MQLFDTGTLVPGRSTAVPRATVDTNPFRSFWMGGFECSDKLNAFGNRVDLAKTSGHLQLLEEDYQRLETFNIRTVREGLRWSQAERQPYTYDWSEVARMLECASRHNVQIVWDLCHFGFPDDLTPLHPMFARRFAAFAKAFVSWYRERYDGELIVTPINEVSFLSFLGGDARGTAPYCIRNGWEVKYGLMKAYIEGIARMKEVDPTIRILTTEPLVNIVPPIGADEGIRQMAAGMNEAQFQVTEMLSGAICPELGGRPEYLDILGYNYYFNNQWDATNHALLPWANDDGDERFRPLHQLIADAYDRYERPIVLTETSHPLEHRPNWVEMITSESILIKTLGIPFWGVCWYPLVDRPDWDHHAIWHRSGLWDAEPGQEGVARTLHLPTAEALWKAQETLC